MAQPTLPCVELVERVTDWMEGALTPEERLDVEEHLAICPHCTEYVHQLRAAADHLASSNGSGAAGAPPPAARKALLETFRRERR